jgi:hypothetical protein
MTARWGYPRHEDEAAWPGLYYVGGREPKPLRLILSEMRERWRPRP